VTVIPIPAQGDPMGLSPSPTVPLVTGTGKPYSESTGNVITIDTITGTGQCADMKAISCSMSEGTASSISGDDGISFTGGEEVSRYIDSSGEVSEEDGEEEGNVSPPPPLVTNIVFDWSGLNFDCLHLSSIHLDNLSEEEQIPEEDLIENYGALQPQTASSASKSDTLQNIINLKHNASVLKDPKTLLKNCKQRLTKRTLKDRSRSVDACSKPSKYKSFFRHRCSEKSRDDLSCPRLSECPNLDTVDSNSVSSECPNTSGSVISLPSSKVRLRQRLSETGWVAGVRRRDSIGLLTQPMISAIRGAGKRVKYRARSVSKGSSMG